MEFNPRYIHAKCAVKNTIVEQWFMVLYANYNFPFNRGASQFGVWSLEFGVDLSTKLQTPNSI